MTQGKELAIADIAQYPALKDPKRTVALIQQSLGGEKLSLFQDLTRIRVPSSGAITWEVADITEAGGTRSEKVVSGIIIHNQYSRAYYAKAYGGAESGPPDCSSWVFDGVGSGNPGGECSICPLNEFNTRDQGTGKACSEKRFMLMLTPTSFRPVVVQVPVTSMRPLRTFGLDLADLQKGINEIVINLALKKETKSGFPTSIIVPSINSYLSDADLERVAGFIEEFAPMMPAPSSRVDVRGHEEFLDDEEGEDPNLPF